mmetsp:Transcript_15483/g.30902  ORF Transcript_15483/g.30902 Transcript_15483/m.30902 type:complete len:164 (-) Transcript_15483:123-614(-)|eukprot:CAMPEP_0182474354 /NCGR_PEP_ID=MMETSP1319-20130603/25493_1 /TAXON_ID=172717 /ORGANISM="Bolidomonas pacifica, Strain RCC208" /LENGTH=163 /DNA_ID=CAMNT_0024675227 /DNA_START=21 /DNA_END=512 /DNA_ORIENTATION=-
MPGFFKRSAKSSSDEGLAESKGGDRAESKGSKGSKGGGAFEVSADIMFFDEEDALDMFGDMEFLSELFPDMVQETTESLRQISDLRGQFDGAALKAAAHAIKGAALNLRLNKLAEAARLLELVGIQGRDGDIDEDEYHEQARGWEDALRAEWATAERWMDEQG